MRGQLTFLPGSHRPVPSALGASRRALLVLLLLAAGLALLLLRDAGVFIAFDSAPPHKDDPALDAPLPQNASCPPGYTVRRSVSRDLVHFEEALGSPLEEQIKRVDHAILEGLIVSGLEPGHLRIEDVSLSPAAVTQPGSADQQKGAVAAAQGGQHHFQRVVVRREQPPESFLDILENELGNLDCQAELMQQNATAWRIRLMGRPTHELLFLPPQPDMKPPEPLPEGEGALVIVMDDLGLDARFARELAVLPEPVSFSVLPRLPHTAEVVAVAREFGRELLLHMPMEPMDASVSPGAGALFVGMPPPRVRELVRENLQRVPGAMGMNNHMGSRFTQDEAGVQAVLDVAAAKGLFVIDSLTHPRSRLADAARSRGVPVLERSVFLDVVKSPENILYQLQKAERLARKNGSAVAIGHPYPETLEALRRWSSQRTDTAMAAQGVAEAASRGGVRVVSARALLAHERQARDRSLAGGDRQASPLAESGISR